MRILKVLIAEADPLLQKLYSDLIVSEPAFTVLKSVSNGPQMFESLRCVEADLVLLDLHLKDFNALDGLEELRKEFPKTDYIVASSGEDPTLVRKALCQGVFEYLIKPFSFERLKFALRNYHIYHQSLTCRTRPWQQEDLDTLVSLKSRDLTWANSRAIPQGLQLKCLNEVENFLKDNNDTYSAQEVGDALGVSRSTARRYLEFLTMNERAVVDFAYRKVGRPEKRYRMSLI